MIKTHFWQPGRRCVVRRFEERTVVHIQIEDCLASRCQMSLLCVTTDSRGFATVAPALVWTGVIPLTPIPAENVTEGQLVLPPVSDIVWARCYVKLQVDAGCEQSVCQPKFDMSDE